MYERDPFLDELKELSIEATPVPDIFCPSCGTKITNKSLCTAHPMCSAECYKKITGQDPMTIEEVKAMSLPGYKGYKKDESY